MGSATPAESENVLLFRWFHALGRLGPLADAFEGSLPLSITSAITPG